MSDRRLTRRAALGLLGLGGATVLSGVAAGESRQDEDLFTHENGQPVGHVIATGEWVDIDPNDPDTYQETHSIGFNDGGSTC